MFRLGLLLLLFLLTADFVAVLANNPRINVRKRSVLIYLDQLYDIEQKKNHSFQNTSQFAEECNARSYDFTVYYRMVYFRVCGNNMTSNETDQDFTPSFAYTNFCNNLKLYYEDNSNLLSIINKQAGLYKIYGEGVSSDERWLTYKACQYIGHYYKAKASVNRNLSNTQENIIYPRFTEWFISAVPFSLPVACGFSVKSYSTDGNATASAACLAPSYKWALYSTFVVDSLILLAIVVANVTIIIVLCRLKSRSAHGLYKLSLAFADLMISLVMAGSMNTTYTTYFGKHVFNEDGYGVIQEDFYQQSYIDGFGCITVLSLSASVFTLVAISLDRFYAISRPFKYKQHPMKKLSILFIIFVWLFGLLLALCPLFITNISYHKTALGVILAHQFYMAYVVCLGGALLCVWIVNIGMYICIKKRIDKSLAKAKIIKKPLPTLSAVAQYSATIKGLESASQTIFMATSINSPITSSNIVSETNQENKTKTKRVPIEVKLAQTVRVIVCAFTIAIVPCIVVIITGLSLALEDSSPHFNPVAKAAWNAFSYISSRILFSNSFVNCLIYSYRSTEFRLSAKNLFSSLLSKVRFKKRIL